MAVVVIVIAWLVVEDIIIEATVIFEVSCSFEGLVFVGVWVVVALDDVVDLSVCWFILKLVL
ncbi:MAG: hypothetical protein ACMG6E_10650 [Candidatus Roizmanbacteria bacterium]